LLASGLQRGAPISEPALTTILTSTLWIGVASALLLFVFAARIKKALSADG
jgi:hypothetical protein